MQGYLYVLIDKTLIVYFLIFCQKGIFIKLKYFDNNIDLSEDEVEVLLFLSVKLTALR